MIDFLALGDLPAAELLDIMRRANELSALWRERRMPQSLTGKRIALIVDDGGWRNTATFDLGIQAMGGTAVHAPFGLAGKESVEDLAGYLDNWFDAVVIRSPSLERMRALATAARAPVVNARTRSNHPCETLADLSFVLGLRGSLDGLKVAAIAPAGNILGSWIEAVAALPIEVVQIYPERWRARHQALPSSRFHATADLAAIAGADVIITDCWPADGTPEELAEFRVTADLLDRARHDCTFIPCPPVTRGEEVAADAMADPRCRAPAAKSFLLHAQNGLLEQLLR